MTCVSIHITGIVQGVGMRPFVYREAVAHHISGWVLNAGDGVRIEAHGDPSSIDAFVHDLGEHAPAASRIDHIAVEPLAHGEPCPLGHVPAAHDPAGGFSILRSHSSAAPTTLIPPDIATCPRCLRELLDPADRRYHYPFINCTDCGPRYTIVRSLPYDRARSSMAEFPLCPACAAEYGDPLDRRFHAQPNACFSCGPHITWRERGRSALEPLVGDALETSDAIVARCAEMIAQGGIVAIKGLGGFHLACNAADEHAVATLRAAKRRSGKPLAIMAARIEDARAVCSVNAIEEQLLTGSARPIVLLQRLAPAPTAAPPGGRSAKTAGTIAQGVAHDLPELGIMLPCTPLQHLLLWACNDLGIGALVMTSGNISGDPIEIDDASAWRRLVEGGVAHALLGNDRAVLARVDDSVARVTADRVGLVRRARGFAPRPLALPALAGGDAALGAGHHGGAPRHETAPGAQGNAPHGECVLACGPQQKATVALTRELPNKTAQCLLSQHIGDLGDARTLDAWHDARQRLCRLFGLRPTAIACDAHPAYLASRWARQEALRLGIPLIAVQHHHAHIASVIAEATSRGELAADERVLGIAFDGTGAGTDGTIWGGEFLVADLYEFHRAAHVMPWPLPGGEACARDPRRSAYSLLRACGLEQHLGARRLMDSMGAQETGILAAMVDRRVNCPLTSSMGRLFDAVSALTGLCRCATYEGEPAIELEAAACRELARIPGARQAWSLAMDTSTPLPPLAWAEPAAEGLPVALDPSPLLEGLLDLLAGGASPDEAALAFHRAVALSTARSAQRLAERTGIRTVALSGGVFMNRLLVERLATLLRARGLHVLLPRDLPVNDGCIAYGQAAVARALLERQRRSAPSNVSQI